MGKPLTKSASDFNFSGKTHNKHPQWYDQPLRLDKEQKRDPLPVLYEFFECYHLNETRQLLWDWLTEVVYSSRISSDSIERANHMHFYEKMEELIEATYVIKRKAHKHKRSKEKRSLKKAKEFEKSQSANVFKIVKPDEVTPITETVPERKLKYYHTRFIERLPIKDESDLQYIKAKYYHLVKILITEYFVFDNKVLPADLLDKTFAVILSDPDDIRLGDMSNFQNFQNNLNLLLLAYAYVMGGKLKVAERFYLDQFINTFEMRASQFTRYTIDHSKSILNALKSIAFSSDESIELLEKAMDFAEAKVGYFYSEKAYINCLANHLVRSAKEKGRPLTRQMLLPQEFKQKFNKQLKKSTVQV